MKNIKRVLSMILHFVMLLSLFSIAVFAEEEETFRSEESVITENRAASSTSFLWPTESKHINALDHYSGGDLHGGIDIGASMKSPVRAVAAGTVVRVRNGCPHTDEVNCHGCYNDSGWESYGNYIVIEHNIGGSIYTSVYAHLTQYSNTLNEGDPVYAGQLIGRSGSSGNSDGAHLHLEIFDGQFRGNIIEVRSKSFQYYVNNPSVLSGMTFSWHMNTSSVYYGSWVEDNCDYDNGIWRYRDGEIGSTMTSGAGRTIPDGDYIIAAATDNRYFMDIPGTAVPAENESNVLLTGPRGENFDACDVWTVTYINDGGFYSIKQKGTDMSLDVYGGSVFENANIQVCPSNGGNAQKWSISSNSDGSYRIQAKCSGFSVDIHGGTITNLTNISQWSNNDGNAQKWIFIPYGSSAYQQDNKITFHSEGGTLGSPIRSRAIDGVNTERLNGQLIVYNNQAQRYNCNSYGLEYAVDSSGAIVVIRSYGEDNQPSVPNGGFILSGHLASPGDDNDGFHFLADLRIGQYIGLNYSSHMAYAYNSYNDYLANNKYVKTGATYGSLPEPVREDYVFDGWYTAAQGGTKIISSSIFCASDLYAHWIPQYYTVAYNANGGSGQPGNQTKTRNTALTLSSTQPTKANTSAGNFTVTLNANGGNVSPTSLTAARTTSYSFKNWNTAQNGSGTSYAPGASYTANAAVTLYAQWNSNTTTSAVTLPTPTRDGYDFKGWATSSTATSGTTGSYTPTGDVTLYATWQIKTYTVAYNANGGSGQPGNQTKTHNTALTLSSTQPTKANTSAGNFTVTLNANGGNVSPTSLTAARTTSYSFKNWNTAQNGSGTSYAPGASYTANAAVTLYAQWNSNTTTAAVTLPTPTRDGYDFKGWATSSTATSGTTGNYTPTGDVTLYATWQIKTYTVTYIANGGWNAPDAQIVELGSALTLSETVPTRGGCIFLGWTESKAALDAKYQPGETLTPSGNLTLYAVWLNLSAPDGKLPSSLKRLEDESLAGCSFRYVKLPEGVEAIGSRVFDGSTRLRAVYIPASVTSIAPDAFAGAPDGFTIVGKAGTYAESYAETYGIRFAEG